MSDIDTCFQVLGFMPHGSCYAWSTPLIALHAISDSLIVLAYYSIPFTLLYFVRRRRDLEFDWMLVAFAAFILACGTTHLMEVWNIWHGHYWLSGSVKAITAFVSVPTAVLLARFVPRALAIPSPAQLTEVNRALHGQIEDRMRSEERLRDAERRYRDLYDSSPDMLFAVDPDSGLITDFNATFLAGTGFQQSEVIGKTFAALVAGNASGREEAAELPREKGRTHRVEIELLRKDGSSIPVSLSAQYVTEPHDGTASIRVSCRDESQNRKTEELELALEASPNAIVMVDEHGKIVLVNAETEKLFGYTREELLGNSVEVLVPRQLRGAHQEDRTGYIARPSRRAMGPGRDLLGLHKDGTEIPVEIGLNPVNTPKGFRVISAITNITERKRAESEVAKYTAELKRSNAELEQFAYVASHDLQEPLRMVASYTELLGTRFQGKLDENADRYINYALDGARRMQQLVTALLSFSRVGKDSRPFQPINTSDLVDSVCETLRDVIERSEGKVERGDLPLVSGDAVRLRQVFQNLISNALKFRGDNAPRVRIQAVKLDDCWRFAVTDNGIGIDMKHAGRLFQMFQRLHERDKYDGSGIGLATVRKIIEQHGGKVWFESEIGKGSTFYFTLPIVTEETR